MAFEFPELSEHSGDRVSDLPAPLFRYLAGKKISTQSKNKFEKLAAQSIGTGISDFTRDHAERMCVIHEQEVRIEKQLATTIGHEMFAAYNKVFDDFRMGQRVRSYILVTSGLQAALIYVEPDCGNGNLLLLNHLKPVQTMSMVRH